jgi:hypothetical protein
MAATESQPRIEPTTDGVLEAMAEIHKRVVAWDEETDAIGLAYEYVCDAVASIGGFENYEAMRNAPYGLVQARLGMPEILDFLQSVDKLSGHIFRDGDGSQFDRNWITEEAARLRVVPEF